MAGRYWSGQIGNIPLEESTGEDAGFQIEGAGAFLSGNWTGNTTPGAKGRPQTQYVELPVGQRITLTFIHAPIFLFADVVDALTPPTLPPGEGVSCEFADGFQTITGVFKLDYPGAINRGEPDGDYLTDAELRLIKIGD